MYGPELSRKRLEVFKEAVPRMARVTVLGNGRNPFNQFLWEDTQPAGRALGIDLRLVMLDELYELAAVFSTMKREADGVVVLADARLNGAREQIVRLAAEHRLPAIYEGREFAEAGGLMSYGPSLANLSRRAAAFVDKVIRGANPADLPVEQPTTFELVINLQAAEALDLAIPPFLLARADEVIK